jgi:FMN phosphatase YigB (HAD superfamily)
MSEVDAVFFDLGETLIDETRWWSDWAAWLGVSSTTLLAVLGAVIERGEDHRKTFEIVRPGLDFDAIWAEKLDEGYEDVVRSDFYPDAHPCVERLKRDGYVVGVAGNQSWIESTIRAHVDLDLVFTAGGLGVAKPDVAFFERIADAVALPPGRIAYVGDRLDNDVAASAAAGMRPVWLRRGPWAFIQQSKASSGVAVVIDSLDELPGALG